MLIHPLISCDFSNQKHTRSGWQPSFLRDGVHLSVAGGREGLCGDRWWQWHWCCVVSAFRILGREEGWLVHRNMLAICEICGLWLKIHRTTHMPMGIHKSYKGNQWEVFFLVNWIMRFLQPRKYGEWKQLQVTINADCKKRMVVCHVLFRIPRDVHLTHLSACQHVFQLQETNRKWSLKWFAETMQQEDHENDEDFGRGVLGLAPCHDDRKTNGGKTAGTSKGRLLLISLWHLAVFVGTGRRVTQTHDTYTHTWQNVRDTRRTQLECHFFLIMFSLRFFW